MDRVICPFCLKPHDFRTPPYQCDTWNENVPTKFVDEYNSVRPLWLVTVGFSKHGKTTFLVSLTLMLEKIARYWKGMHYSPLGAYTFEAIRQMRRETMHGELPESTKREAMVRPLLFSVYNIPDHGSRCLVMYDVSGEEYDSLPEQPKYVPALKQATTTWFLVSLDDLLKNEAGQTLPDLFQVYVAGMESQHIEVKGKNLVVVYTKSDIVRFSSEIRDYIMDDPFKVVVKAGPQGTPVEPISHPQEDYIARMKEVSALLREYTEESVEGGSAFINMVEANGMNLAFSAISALGKEPDPDTNDMSVDAVPHRVLDPLLWATVLETPKPQRAFTLVADAHTDCAPVYSTNLLASISDKLSEYGALTAYYLGQRTAASLPGQHLPSAPPKVSRPRLIGPILEKLCPADRLMVLTNGPIRDLPDFYRSDWQDRLLIVEFNEVDANDWENKMFYHSEDASDSFVHRLLTMSGVNQ